MDRIKRLQARLLEAQLKDSRNTVSEANVVEFMNLMHGIGTLSFVYTLDGKEYVTIDRIDEEIKRELDRLGGRVSFIDIPHLLNIDIKHVEESAMRISSKGENIITFQRELITTSYLDEIADEISVNLKENGTLKLSELCLRYSLPFDFLYKAMADRIGKSIKAYVDPTEKGLFYTDNYITSQRDCLKGLLLACTRPVRLISLIENQNLTLSAASAYTAEFVRQGVISGKLIGKRDGEVYQPAVYIRTLKSYIVDYINRNGFMGYEDIVKLDVGNVNSFIASCGTHFTMLSTIAVSEIIRNSVEDLLNDAMAKETYQNIAMYLGFPISSEDFSLLIGACPSVKDMNYKLFLDRYFVSEKFFDKCRNASFSLIQSKVEKAQKIWNQRSDSNGRMEVKNEFNRKELSTNLLEKMELPIDLAKQLASCFEDQVNSQLSDRLQEAFESAGRSDNGGRQDELNYKKLIEMDLWVQFLLYLKGLECLESDPVLHQNLTRHLMKSFGMTILNAFLIHYAKTMDNSNVDTEILREIQSIRYPEYVDSKLRRALIETMPSEFSNLFDTSYSACKKPTKDVKEITSKMEELGRILGLTNPVHASDYQRSAMDRMKKGHFKNLCETDDPALALHLAVILAFIHYRGACLYASGRFVPQLLQNLENAMNPNIYAIFKQLFGIIMDKSDGRIVMKELKKAVQRDFNI